MDDIMNNKVILEEKDWKMLCNENYGLKVENQELKNKLKILKEDITAIYNEMIALEIIDKHDDIEEI